MSAADQRYCSSWATLSLSADRSGVSETGGGAGCGGAALPSLFGGFRCPMRRAARCGAARPSLFGGPACPMRRAAISAFSRPESSRPKARHSSFRRSRGRSGRISSSLRLPRCGQGFDEFRFDAAVADFQLVVLDVGAELVRGQLRENGAFRRHWSVSVRAGASPRSRRCESPRSSAD